MDSFVAKPVINHHVVPLRRDFFWYNDFSATFVTFRQASVAKDESTGSSFKTPKFMIF